MCPPEVCFSFSSDRCCRWGPLNLLVYMGLRHPKYADVPEIQAARKQLAIQSREAMMVEWLPKHHVHENLNPDTGEGDDVGNSNPMYKLALRSSLVADPRKQPFNTTRREYA